MTKSSTWIKSLAVKGYRGFESRQSLPLAVPDGKRRGSGLTVLVGPNSGGKSSVIELAVNIGARLGAEMKLKQSMRNSASELVTLTVRTKGGRSILQNTTGAPYHLQWLERAPDAEALVGHIYVVPPRRQFEVYFGEGRAQRSQYALDSSSFRPNRQEYVRPTSRLMTLVEDPEAKRDFDKTLRHLLGFDLTWRLDLGENNQFYFRVDKPGGFHDSDGMGFGIVSLIFILDSLRDLGDGDIVVIDEPELSLHPAVQRRLAKQLLDTSKDHQVVIATHSPYFANISWIQEGAEFARVASGSTGSRIFKLKQETRSKLRGLSADVNNPHSLGLEASEFLFLDEVVVLTEGQEDALLLPRLAEQVGMELHQSLYGWGVGGADKMEIVCQMLQDFGLKRVIGVLDGDKEGARKTLERKFPRYKFFTLPADDIRDKRRRPAVPAKAGLADSKGKIHSKHEKALEVLIGKINEAYPAGSNVTG